MSAIEITMKYCGENETELLKYVVIPVHGTTDIKVHKALSNQVIAGLRSAANDIERSLQEKTGD